MKEYLDAILRHGGMFSVEQAAKLSGRSHQRISQLIKAGRLPLVEVVFGVTPTQEVVMEELIPGNALRFWMEGEKPKGGRGVRAPQILPTAMAA